MNNFQKLLTTIGMSQLIVEYIEEIMDDPNFSPLFIRELKRDAKNYVKSSEKMINALSRDADIQVHEQISGLYVAVSNLVEKGILWDEPKEAEEWSGN